MSDKKIVENMQSTREQDIQAELRFWRRALGEDITPDMERRMQWDQKLIPNSVISMLASMDNTPLILDIGCGPLSSLAGTQRMGARLIGIDPLRPQYKQILNENEIDDNCLMLYAEAEDTLRLQIFREEGDIVWMCNAIDHAQDPYTVWQNLKMMTKPGGYLVLTTHINEAIRGKYHGMHKINIWPDEAGNIVCQVKDEPSYILDYADDFKVIEFTEKTNKKGIRVLTVILRKLQPLEK